MNSLSRPLETMSIYEREKHTDGSYVRNKCGRDFLYYALHYYFPDKFNAHECNPVALDAKRAFGRPVPAWLAWTQLQFARAGSFCQSLGLQLSINGRLVTTYTDFIHASLLSRITYSEAIALIQRTVDADRVCAIDLPVGRGPLVYLDHVLFVYGYDEDNLYVLDTHVESKVPYEQMAGAPFYFKLPLKEVATRWGRTGRVWRVLRE